MDCASTRRRSATISPRWPTICGPPPTALPVAGSGAVRVDSRLAAACRRRAAVGLARGQLDPRVARRHPLGDPDQRGHRRHRSRRSSTALGGTTEGLVAAQPRRRRRGASPPASPDARGEGVRQRRRRQRGRHRATDSRWRIASTTFRQRRGAALAPTRPSGSSTLLEPVSDRFVERIDATAGPNWMPTARVIGATRMITIERTRTIPAHLTRVWDVLADFDRLADWADNADHTCWLDEPARDGEMVGRARRVQAGRVVLVERITVWEPPARLAYDLGGLPPVVKSAVNEWRFAGRSGERRADHRHADHPCRLWASTAATTGRPPRRRPPGQGLRRDAGRPGRPSRCD